MCIWATKRKTRHVLFMIKWEVHGTGSFREIFSLYCSEHMGNNVEGLEGVHGGNEIGKRNVEGRLLEFCDEKELCAANT